MLKSILLTTVFLYSVQPFPHEFRNRYNRCCTHSSNCNQNIINTAKYRESITTRNCAPTIAWGEGLSQEDLMNKDECIIVDERDRIIGHDSKYNSHRFDSKNPNGILHRAFSVFLFNEDGKLLLQKRASDKITFPDVWTNTCCSHPLYGYSPTEVDDEESVNKGELTGIKSAAIRKLKHELGIEPEQVSIQGFKYLGRIHYCAADTSNSASGVVDASVDGVWGEHEIDYILFIRAKVDLVPNPEEVGEWKYVNLQELKDMMNVSIPQGAGLKWSPWFRHIVDGLLVKWWRDLDSTLHTDSCVDLENIYRF